MIHIYIIVVYNGTIKIQKRVDHISQIGRDAELQILYWYTCICYGTSRSLFWLILGMSDFIIKTKRGYLGEPGFFFLRF